MGILVGNTPLKPVDSNDSHICGMPVETWSRVVGYFRPVSSWNHGKKEEFKDRVKFDMDLARCHINSK